MEETEKAIKDRLSFLEDNSYRYRMAKNNIKADEIKLQALKLKEEARKLNIKI